VTNNEHAARLRDLAQQELDMAKVFTPMYSSGLIATCRADAAALLAGAEALEAVEVAKAALQAEAWRIYNCTWTMDGTVYRILLGDQHAVAAAYKAALARMEGK
jgi:hypothetical protein